MAATGGTGFRPGAQRLNLDAYDPVTRTIEGGLNQLGPSLDRFFGGIIPKGIQDWGRAQEKSGWGALMNFSSPFGFVGAPAVNALTGSNRNISVPAQQSVLRPGTTSTPVLDRGRVAAPATSPNTITQRADDTYKQLLSQYGGQTGLSQLAGQTSLPTGFTPEGGKQAASLKDYYAAQQAVGAKNIGDIISSMGYTGPMAEWAKANPMLAQREFAKYRASSGRTSEDVTDQAMKEAAAKGQYFAPPGGPTPDPVTQQRMQQYSTAFQAGLGTESTSASQRSMDFLKKIGVGTLNPDSYNFKNESGASPYSNDSIYNLNINYPGKPSTPLF